eukprot:TRINITY_DN16509_c0_g2_i1.p1 TRINITY_DN16509_c0_g2~~TRINITY_DN16509_c0_g2_i1.p1  ORF type:complete len:898 (+),score=144.46 TRINITY_DN16509_c0_g2_i1:216-2696(+)
MSKLSKVKKVETCAEIQDKADDVDRKGARDKLLSQSGDNVILKSMKQAKSSSELGTKVQENTSIGWLIGKAGPIVMTFIMFFIFIICCCTACPCCKCCRRCKGRHNVRKPVKLVFFISLCGIVFGLLVAASMSVAGFGKAVDGFEMTSCATAKMVDSTLNGQTGPYFLGMLPTLKVFQELIDSFNAGSAFLTQLGGVLDDTKAITAANNLASGTLGLLLDMMANKQNQKPQSSGGKDLLHDCELCTQLEKVLKPVKTNLDSSLGQALDAARSEVKKQLQGPKLKDLQGQIISATDPLKQVKEMVRDTFGDNIVKNDAFANITSNLRQFGTMGSAFLFIIGILIVTCGFSSVGLWTFREKRKYIEGEPVKYRNGVHRCALCTWCWGFCYVMFAFFVGGLMVMLSIPFSGICLIMNDVNSQMLTDIGPSIGLNLTGTAGPMVNDIIDQCFRPVNPNANPLLLDIIYTMNGTKKTTLKERIVDQTKTNINKQFDKIGQRNTSVDLSNNDAMKTLKRTLRDTRIDAMMKPRLREWNRDSLYQGMGFDQNSGNDKLMTFTIASSASCDDFYVPAENGPLSGSKIPGIWSFGYRLKNFSNLNTMIPSAGCIRKADCSHTTPTSNAGQACRAGNNFMDLKAGLQGPKIFRCKSFYVGAIKCDIKTMTETPPGSGKYTNDCLAADGTLEAKEYACDISEFTTLVQDFDIRLDKVFKRLGTASTATMSKISVDMKKVVDTNVLAKIDAVANGVTCGFLNQAYQNVIDGMCFTGVVGFIQVADSYVACAALSLLLIILMYTVWRISVDNYNHIVEDEVKDLVTEANVIGNETHETA